MSVTGPSSSGDPFKHREAGKLPETSLSSIPLDEGGKPSVDDKIIEGAIRSLGFRDAGDAIVQLDREWSVSDKDKLPVTIKVSRQLIRLISESHFEEHMPKDPVSRNLARDMQIISLAKDGIDVIETVYEEAPKDPAMRRQVLNILAKIPAESRTVALAQQLISDMQVRVDAARDKYPHLDPNTILTIVGKINPTTFDINQYDLSLDHTHDDALEEVLSFLNANFTLQHYFHDHLVDLSPIAIIEIINSRELSNPISDSDAYVLLDSVAILSQVPGLSQKEGFATQVLTFRKSLSSAPEQSPALSGIINVLKSEGGEERLAEIEEMTDRTLLLSQLAYVKPEYITRDVISRYSHYYPFSESSSELRQLGGQLAAFPSPSKDQSLEIRIGFISARKDGSGGTIVDQEDLYATTKLALSLLSNRPKSQSSTKEILDLLDSLGPEKRKSLIAEKS